MKIKNIILLICTVLVLFACDEKKNSDGNNNDLINSMLGELEDNRNIWISKNITSYSYKSSNIGFLPKNTEIIIVNNNAVTSIFYELKDESGYKSETEVNAHQGFYSVFEYIKTKLENYQNCDIEGEGSISATYNNIYGYPTKFYQSCGEGWGIEYSDFTILDE